MMILIYLLLAVFAVLFIVVVPGPFIYQMYHVIKANILNQRTSHDDAS